MVADPSTTSLPHIQAGKLRALAIAGAERFAKLPDVPTTAEAGFPKLQSPFWLGVVAPAGTPPAIIDKLNAAFRDSLARRRRATRLANLGAEIKIGTPEAFGKMLAEELALWTGVVKAANIKGIERFASSLGESAQARREFAPAGSAHRANGRGSAACRDTL